jgi:hypothetical protein
MEERGWDPDVKRYFRKIINSFSFGMLWLMANATAGIYYGLAWSAGKPLIYTILFYLGMAGSLVLLIYYFRKTWKNKEKDPSI